MEHDTIERTEERMLVLSHSQVLVLIKFHFSHQSSLHRVMTPA